ncbi:MAG: hypothetical protein AB1899_06030 [Pseudomonadota bacterium]
MTAVAIGVAMVVYVLAPDMTTRSQFGDFLSGFGSAIAFVWLVAAYQQQGRELQLQRHELSLQRAALDLQRLELQKMGKYAAMEQVEHILGQFDSALQANRDSPVRSATDLPSAFVNGMALWKTLLESNDNQAKLTAYTTWMKILGPCSEFLARVVTASDLYAEATDTARLPPGESPAHRIYSGQQILLDAPYVRHYSGAAYTLAVSFVLGEPGLDRLQFAGLSATEALMPGVVNAEAIAALKVKVEAHDMALRQARAKNTI